MGKALAAFILNLLRQGIFLIPLIFILDHFFGLTGVNALEEDIWKIYKQAYKKYHARLMKGSMSRA